jgi:hypothetical protein
MFKRHVPFPVLVARRSHLLGCVTYAKVGSPVFLTEAAAFQIKADSPKHLVGNEARFDPRLCAIDQGVDQDAGFLRYKRLIVDGVSHWSERCSPDFTKEKL